MAEKFSRDRLFREFGEWIEARLAARDELRAKNLVGAMLRHHIHRSTEYFSRWIELKGKQGPEARP